MKKNFNHIHEEKERIDPKNYRFGIFYYNRKDSRAVVPKWQRARGWTLNFANPLAYLLILAILAIIASFIILA